MSHLGLLHYILYVLGDDRTGTYVQQSRVRIQEAAAV
jgi:hypothetical protein